MRKILIAFVPCFLFGCAGKISWDFPFLSSPEAVAKVGGTIGSAFGPVGEAIGSDLGYVLATGASIYAMKKRGDHKAEQAKSRK